MPRDEKTEKTCVMCGNVGRKSPTHAWCINPRCDAYGIDFPLPDWEGISTAKIKEQKESRAREIAARRERFQVVDDGSEDGLGIPEVGVAADDPDDQI